MDTRTKADEFETLWASLMKRYEEYDVLWATWEATTFVTRGARKGHALRLRKAQAAIDRVRCALLDWCRTKGETPPSCVAMGGC